MNLEVKDLLTVLVGSRAHGLSNDDSDYDYRTVFVQPTSELLKVGGVVHKSSWREADETSRIDDTGWEIRHFLELATHSNPTILEVFLAPIESATADGERLRALFPHVWSGEAAKNAFIGYGLNQRKKFLDNKDKRRAKYATAYLRTLIWGTELLTTGTFTVRIAYQADKGILLRRYRDGDFEVGEVIDTCLHWQELLESAWDQSPYKFKVPDMDKINEFLLDLRRQEW